MDSRIIPLQVIVFGRGMDGEMPTLATRQRAEAASQFVNDNYTAIGHVIFSGGRSHGSDYGERPSEASVMKDIANLPPEIPCTLEDKSNSTLANLINCALILDLENPVGLIAHKNFHMRRVKYLAERVLATEVICIEAENYGASPEESGRLLELGLLFKEKLVLAGVKSGDTERMRIRLERAQQIMNSLSPIKKLLMRNKPQYR